MAGKKQFEIVSNGLSVRAPAKINLTLLIAGKRPDGFHEIETIMAKINFYDEILIRQAQKSGIELICRGPHWAPAGEENLVYQACKMLLAGCGSKANIKLTLTKNIPAGSGLGSASSDAAAVLIGLNRFLELQVEPKRLGEMAARLGSDVAFFLGGPLAFCTGKGEKVKKIDKIFDFSAILVLPDISISTKTVYNVYNHNIDLYKKLNTRIKNLLQKNRIDLASKMCANMLQTTCLGLYKGLAELKAEIESLSISPLCLSGSGSAMFSIIDNADEERAIENERKLEQNIGCNSIIISNNRW